MSWFPLMLHAFYQIMRVSKIALLYIIPHWFSKFFFHCSVQNGFYDDKRQRQTKSYLINEGEKQILKERQSIHLHVCLASSRTASVAEIWQVRACHQTLTTLQESTILLSNKPCWLNIHTILSNPSWQFSPFPSTHTKMNCTCPLQEKISMR